MKPFSIEEFSTVCRELTCVEKLKSTAVNFFQGQGAAMMSYYHLPPPGADDYFQGVSVCAEGFPRAWIERYVDENFIDIDPLPKTVLSETTPVWWSDVRARTGMSSNEIRFLDIFQEADLGDGLAIPVFGPHRRNGYVGLGIGKGGRRFCLDKVSFLQRAAQVAHLTYCRILRERTPNDVKLSAREEEILEWVARGKSNAVIAEIIGISPNTVDTYLRRIFGKLNVSDRVSATLRGFSNGLID